MAELPNIDLKVVKALSKEKRMALATDIRRDTELFNALNGMGGLSENASNGLLQGTITVKGSPQARLRVTAIGKTGQETTTLTNVQGYYKMNLSADTYAIKVAGTVLDKVSVTIVNGQTSTLNHDLPAPSK